MSNASLRRRNPAKYALSPANRPRSRASLAVTGLVFCILCSPVPSAGGGPIRVPWGFRCISILRHEICSVLRRFRQMRFANAPHTKTGLKACGKQIEKYQNLHVTHTGTDPLIVDDNSGSALVVRP